MLTVLVWPRSSAADPPGAGASPLEAALGDILTVQYAGQDGLVTVWDDNKYIQCRRRSKTDVLTCEAGGALMQPSLGHVLRPQNIERLNALGWRLDPSFGAYVQAFPVPTPAKRLADQVSQALAEGYGADIANLEVRSTWIASEPCPPRHGPGQNLAGMIDDAPIMAANAIHACAYTPDPVAHSAQALMIRYEARVLDQLQRMRTDLDGSRFFALDTGAGYVQCRRESPPTVIYCEAQSADSWRVLEHILTPDHVDRLHAAGYADPGATQNYSKFYPVEAFDDHAIADEILALLYDVYDYDGTPELEIKTDQGDN